MDWNNIISNPWVGIAGTLFGIIGILVSVVLYLRTRRFQQPAYYKTSLRWYDGKQAPHSDIRLMFRGKEISRFTITQLAFWNAGNQTVREADFVPASPLRLVISEDIEVFDIRITRVTTPEIRASLDTREPLNAGMKKEIPVHFDYLDKDDGFSIQAIHDGSTDEKISFVGKLPGVSKFRLGTTSFSKEPTLISRSGRGQLIPYTPPLVRWLIVPLAFFGLGGLGLWSLYWAIFKEFHWYQIFGAMFVVYLVLPFIVFGEANPPKALCDAPTETDSES